MSDFSYVNHFVLRTDVLIYMRLKLPLSIEREKCIIFVGYDDGKVALVCLKIHVEVKSFAWLYKESLLYLKSVMNSTIGIDSDLVCIVWVRLGWLLESIDAPELENFDYLIFCEHLQFRVIYNMIHK